MIGRRAFTTLLMTSCMALTASATRAHGLKRLVLDVFAYPPEARLDQSEPAAKKYAPPELITPAPTSGLDSADPLLETAWHLDYIDVQSAWKVTEGKPETVIAVIDSGINYNHPEIAANIVRDGDTVGKNFNEEHGLLPWDDNGHGTFVSTIIAGIKNNGIGASGVCPKCNILPIRVIDKDGRADDEDEYKALEYAIAQKVSVINLSMVGEGMDLKIHNLIKAAGEANIAVVVSAGNDGENNDKSDIYPANSRLPNVITVAASRKDGDLWENSNWGASKVHIAAPGVFIWGLWVDEKFYRSHGTSFAAPIVSGALGLIRTANPKLSAVEAIKVLLNTVTPSKALDAKIHSKGIVNVGQAMACAVDPALPCLSKKHSRE